MAKYRVLYQKAPRWLIGEHEDDAWARRKARGTGIPDRWYPGDYPGKVIAVLPALNKSDPAAADVVELSLTDEAYSGLAGRTLKIVAGRPVPVTFEDRHGATAQALRDEFASIGHDAESVEVMAEAVGLEEPTVKDTELVERFGRVAVSAQNALAPTVFAIRGEAL